jgi:iron complex transport system ATP-binding protein
LEAQWEPRGRARNGTALIAILRDPHLATRFADRSILLHRGWLTIDDPRETAMSSK